MNEISRVQHPFPLREFYLNYFIARRPVVIRTQSLVELDWRTDRWSNEYLAHRAGNQDVMVLQRSPEADFMPERAAFEHMLFRDFIAKVMAAPRGNDTAYLNLQELAKNRVIEAPLLQLIGDFCIPVYFKDLLLRCINVWMGNSSSAITTPLHHDFNDNLYVVVSGKKQFTLFPPEQAANLYTRGELVEVESNGHIKYRSLEGMPHLSQVDINNPDLQRFPRYAHAAPARIELALNANELLFMPNGWFHQVTSIGRHVALSFAAVTPPPDRLAWMRSSLL